MRSISLFSLLIATLVDKHESMVMNGNMMKGNTAKGKDIVDRRIMLKSLVACTTLLTPGLISIRPAQAQIEDNGQPKKSKSINEEYRQGTSALSGMDENAPIPKESYTKLPSGVVYADIRPGQGETASAGSRVNLQWVLRKSNGYFVDSSEVQNGVPFIFNVGAKNTAIEGVNEGVLGMKAGGTRRLLIPVNLAYVNGLEDGKPGPLPAGYGPKQQMRRVQTVRKDVPGEYVFLEVQATRVRN